MNEITHIPNLASVTKEMVAETAKSNPELFVKDGEIDLYTVLYALGFYIDKNDYQKGIRTTEDVIVRNHLQPEFTYITTVYAGKCRRAVKFVRDGKIVYDKNKWHSNKELFEQREVLAPDNIYEYIPKHTMANVLEIGDINFYNKDKDKKTKKIVKSKSEVEKGETYPGEGYTPEEWQSRKKFENMYTDKETYAAYESDLDTLEIG